MKILFFLLVLFVVTTDARASFDLRMKYVGTTNTPNLDVRWRAEVNYFGYQVWNVSGGSDIYTPNETRDTLGISDSVIPADGNTFTVEWAIAGSGVWNTGSASVLVPRGGSSGVMEWTLGGAPASPNTYSTTNTTRDPIFLEYKDGTQKQTITLQPGESFTVTR